MKETKKVADRLRGSPSGDGVVPLLTINP